MTIDRYRFMGADQFLTAHLDRIPEDLRPRVESCLLRPSKADVDYLDYQLIRAQDRLSGAERELSEVQADRDFLETRVFDLERQLREYQKEEAKQQTLISSTGRAS